MIMFRLNFNNETFLTRGPIDLGAARERFLLLFMFGSQGDQPPPPPSTV